VLTAKSQSDRSSWNSTQDRELSQKLQRQWKTPDRRLATQSRANEALVRENLKSLDYSRGKFAASLDFTKPFVGHPAMQQGLRKNVRGGNRVLNGEIDTDATDWRHRMSRISDA
jgi:hypothetical protein